MSTTKISFVLPESMLAALETIADGANVSDVLRDAVSEYLRARGWDVDTEVERGGYKGERTPVVEFPADKTEFTPKEAAQFLGLHVSRVRAHLGAGVLHARKKNPALKRSDLILDRAELERFKNR